MNEKKKNKQNIKIHPELDIPSHEEIENEVYIFDGSP